MSRTGMELTDLDPDTEQSIAAARASRIPHALVLRHASVARRIALRFARRVPRHVEVNDLIQAGMVGLLEAIQRFAPREGASFETSAWFRIRGAIVDSVRKTDWSTRSLRRLIREIEIAKCRIQNAKGEVAKSADVAAALGMSLKSCHNTLHGAAISDLVRLGAPSRVDAARVCDASVDSGAGLSDEAEQEELRRDVAAAIDGLPENERVVMRLYYYDEPTLRKIGEKPALSEGRVCQIHGQAAQRLRALLMRWTRNKIQRAAIRRKVHRRRQGHLMQAVRLRKLRQASRLEMPLDGPAI